MPLPESKVTMTIEGLALCLYNQRLRRWEIGFPYDNLHHLAISIRTITNEVPGNWVNIPISVGQKLHITAQGARNLPIKKPNFSAFIDLEDPAWMHTSGVRNISTPQNSILVSIANACFSVNSMTSEPYRLVRKVANGNVPVTRLGQMGEVAKAEIDFQNNGDLNVQIEGNAATTYQINQNVRYEIKFDNDCHCLKTESDFDIYYTIADPIDDTNRYILEPDWRSAVVENLIAGQDEKEAIVAEVKKRNRRRKHAGRVDCDVAQLSQLDTWF